MVRWEGKQPQANSQGARVVSWTNDDSRANSPSSLARYPGEARQAWQGFRGQNWINWPVSKLCGVLVRRLRAGQEGLAEERRSKRLRSRLCRPMCDTKDKCPKGLAQLPGVRS